MRTLVGIAFILSGVFVSLTQLQNNTETVTNNQIYRGMTGLHVSLPYDMKDFPVELVPLP